MGRTITRRRTRQDIMAEILRVAKVGAIKTRIVYGANLNFKMAKPYLENMVSNELLRFEDDLYHTTDKGIVFLGHYEEMMRQQQTLMTY